MNKKKCCLCGNLVYIGKIVRFSKKEVTDEKGRMIPGFDKFSNHNWNKGKIKICKKCLKTD